MTTDEIIKELNKKIESLENELAITKEKANYYKSEYQGLCISINNKNKEIRQLKKELTVLNQKFNEANK